MTEGHGARPRANLDETVDLVVRQMMSAPPPSDLRHRVLARLARSEPRPVPSIAWQRPAWGLAAGLIVAWLAWTLWPSQEPAVRLARKQTVERPSVSVAGERAVASRIPDRDEPVGSVPPTTTSASGRPGPATTDARSPRAVVNPAEPTPVVVSTVTGPAAQPLEPLEPPGAVALEVMEFDRLMVTDLSVSHLEIESLDLTPLAESWPQ